MVKKTFITTREREVVEALTASNRYMMVPTERLACSQSSINSTLTFVFDKFMDALRLMANEEHTDTFASRFKKNNEEIRSLTRKIRANSKRCSD